MYICMYVNTCLHVLYRKTGTVYVIFDFIELIPNIKFYLLIIYVRIKDINFIKAFLLNLFEINYLKCCVTDMKYIHLLCILVGTVQSHKRIHFLDYHLFESSKLILACICLNLVYCFCLLKLSSSYCKQHCSKSFTSLLRITYDFSSSSTRKDVSEINSFSFYGF